MHALPFNDHDTFLEKPKSITLFSLCILISVCIHIAVFVTVINNHCFDCNNTIDHATKPLSIKLMKEPPVPPTLTTNKMVNEVIDEERIETQTPIPHSIENKPDITQSKPITIKPNKINYATLNSSINTFLKEDEHQNRQTWETNCENYKKISGTNECIPLIERLGLESEDPYGFTKIFKRLVNTSSKIKKQKIITQLVFKKDTLVSILDNENIDEETRRFLHEELISLRDEINYQDCDGALNSGNCAGQADLFKMTNLLIKLFNKK